MTFQLLTTKEGKKMGKTMGGAVWLDAGKFSPYDFFQYWRNVEDADVIKCLKFLTFLPIEEIEAMEAWEGSQLNRAKEILAYKVTSFVHGKEEADKALAAAKALFGAGGQDENMPTTVLTEADFTDGAIGIMDLMVKTGLAPSKSEARRLIQGGGVVAGEEKVTDVNQKFSADAIRQGLVLRKGKKVFHKVML